jgi:YD repeat-containing protein
MNFEYKNSFNKVSKVNTEFFDGKGKVAKKRETLFAYDNRGNLADAKNSDGQSVKLTYDQRGRISTITDQAKKEVQIKYEERTGRPAQITRPKVGTIAVTYKANGEINKVESNDGAAVATQVASTFNNLLDIIAPATSEMNL